MSSAGRFSVYGSMDSSDLLQAKVEHLEKERMDLSLKLHQRDERERTWKIKMEQMELQLKASEQAKQELASSLQSAKDQLEAEHRKKSSGPSANSGGVCGDANTQGLWNKMTAASRELRRVEEELKSALADKELAVFERESIQQQLSALQTKQSNDEKVIRQLSRASDEAKLVQSKLELSLEKNKRFEEEIGKLKKRCADLTQEHTAVLQQHELQVETLQGEVQRLQSEVEDWKEKAAKHGSSLLATGSVDEVGADESDAARASSRDVTELQAFVTELQQRLQNSESQRRKLHNTLQELRGNIRVYVRCRPFLRNDGDSRERGLECGRDGSSVSLVRGGGIPSQSFSFDQVFKPDASQDDVYREVAELVQSALDGYRVCIFSYGQTGSGKTHTMTGDRRGAQRGIIPRAVEQIIEQVGRMRSEGWTVSVTVSIVELYNEDLRDLLVPPSSSKESKDKDKLKIQHTQGRVAVAGLVAVELNTAELRVGVKQLDQLLDTAAKVRTTASTGMNEHSSRSHVLFLLDISGTHSDGRTVMRGGLRLVDLAGSERLDRTGTLNDAVRLKETVNINKSLTCLADVFIALSNKQQHIPYRNSKLTMLLQDCLSGDGKALMFVNVSPTVASSQESLCSLRFASQVSQVELGKAQKNVYTVPASAVPVPVPAPIAAPTQATDASGSGSGGSTSSSSSAVTAGRVRSYANIEHAESALGGVSNSTTSSNTAAAITARARSAAMAMRASTTAGPQHQQQSAVTRRVSSAVGGAPSADHTAPTNVVTSAAGGSFLSHGATSSTVPSSSSGSASLLSQHNATGAKLSLVNAATLNASRPVLAVQDQNIQESADSSLRASGAAPPTKRSRASILVSQGQQQNMGLVGQQSIGGRTSSAWR